MLIKKTRHSTFCVGAEAFPREDSMPEVYPIRSPLGYVNVGCFAAYKDGYLTSFNETDDGAAAYCFVLDDGRSEKRGATKRVMLNGRCARVLLMSKIMRVTPLIVDELGNYPEILQVIKWSTDDEKWPNGAIIFSDQESSNYKTFSISGSLFEYEDI